MPPQVAHVNTGNIMKYLTSSQNVLGWERDSIHQSLITCKSNKTSEIYLLAFLQEVTFHNPIKNGALMSLDFG